jgi:hypothetical protein
MEMVVVHFRRLPHHPREECNSHVTSRKNLRNSPHHQRNIVKKYHPHGQLLELTILMTVKSDHVMSLHAMSLHGRILHEMNHLGWSARLAWWGAAYQGEGEEAVAAVEYE